MEQQDLIPGLPDHIAAECLLRISHNNLSLANNVCRSWRQELFSLNFASRRRLAGLSHSFLAFSFSCRFDFCAWFIGLFDPESGHWRGIPSMPDLLNTRADFRLIGVGHHIVAMDISDEGSTYVYTYSLLTNKWSRSTPSPHVLRPRMSACASDGVKRVFIAGGFGPVAPTSSAVFYDVHEDRWELLPVMAEPRAGCFGYFHRGTFLVTGGFNLVDPFYRVKHTHKNAERLNLSTGDWSLEDFVPCPIDNWVNNNPVAAPDGCMYYFKLKEMKLLIKEGKRWRWLCDLPSDDFRYCPNVHSLAWKEGFAIIKPLSILLLYDQFTIVQSGTDDKLLVWKEIQLPYEFTKKPLVSSCYLQV